MVSWSNFIYRLIFLQNCTDFFLNSLSPTDQIYEIFINTSNATVFVRLKPRTYLWVKGYSRYWGGARSTVGPFSRPSYTLRTHPPTHSLVRPRNSSYPTPKRNRRLNDCVASTLPLCQYNQIIFPVIGFFSYWPDRPTFYRFLGFSRRIQVWLYHYHLVVPDWLGSAVWCSSRFSWSRLNQTRWVLLSFLDCPKV